MKKVIFTERVLYIPFVAGPSLPPHLSSNNDADSSSEDPEDPETDNPLPARMPEAVMDRVQCSSSAVLPALYGPSLPREYDDPSSASFLPPPEPSSTRASRVQGPAMPPDMLPVFEAVLLEGAEEEGETEEDEVDWEDREEEEEQFYGPAPPPSFNNSSVTEDFFLFHSSHGLSVEYN